MEKYDDKDIEDINWTKYKIIVPTEEDKKSLEEAFEHFHNSDVDSNFVPVNQLIHEYLTPERTGDLRTKNNIVVNKELYDREFSPLLDDGELKKLIWEDWEGEIKEEDPREMVFKYMKKMREVFTNKK